MIKLEHRSPRIKHEEMEKFKNIKGGRCLRRFDGCWIEASAKKLYSLFLCSSTTTEVKQYFMYTVVVHNDELVAGGGDRIDTALASGAP